MQRMIGLSALVLLIPVFCVVGTGAGANRQSETSDRDIRVRRRYSWTAGSTRKLGCELLR